MRRLNLPRRGSAATVVAVLAAYGVLTVGAGAAWAAYSVMTLNNSNSFATGDVVSLTNSVNTALLSLSNAKPGDQVAGCIRLTYAGSLPTTVRLYGLTAGTGADPYLALKITRGAHAAAPYTTCATFSADATTHVSRQTPGVVYAGTVQDYHDNYDAGLVDPSMSAPETWTGGESHSYKFEVTVGDNRTAEAKNVTQTFSWEARSSLSYSETVLSDAPVSYWRFGESAGTNAVDQMARSNGTYTAGPTLGQPGALASGSDTAASFDGVDDYVLVGNSASLQLTTGTIEAWVKAAAPGTSFRGIMSKTNAYGLFLYNGTLATYDYGVSANRDSGVNLADGNWHHVVMSFQSGVANGTKLYSDGVLVLATTLTVIGQASPPNIAGGNSGTSQRLGGSVDEAAIYNSVLSAEQIKSHYVAGRLS